MLGAVNKASKVASTVRARLPPKQRTFGQSLKNDRHPGTFGSLFKSATLAALLKEVKAQDASSMTYLNVLGGGAGSQIKVSHINRDAIMLHRWLRLPASWRSIPEDIELLKPYLQQFEAANHNVSEDADGFPTTLFLPSENAIAYSHLGPADRATIYDDDALSHETLEQLVGHDRRVSLRGAFDNSQSHMNSLFPLRGRGFVWLDMGLVPTFAEQARVHNVVLETLKTQPHATIGVCYPAPEGRMPWQLVDMLAHCGSLNVWNVVHYADDAHMERSVRETLSKHQGFDAELKAKHAAFMATGEVPYQASMSRATDLNENPLPPEMLRLARPETAWAGTGIALVNAPPNFGEKARKIGGALKEILGKPDGWVHSALAPLHAEPMREYGASYKKLSYSIPGFGGLGEEFQKTHPEDLPASLRTHFLSDAVHAAVAMDDTDAPRTVEQIVQDTMSRTHISAHTREILTASTPGLAEAEAYATASQVPMDRIVGDLETYQYGRRGIKVEIDRKREEEEILRRNAANSSKVLQHDFIRSRGTKRA